MCRLNIEQERAARAFEFATAGNLIAEYPTNAQKLPMYIKVNGLGNTIAFMYSKKNNKGWALLYKQLRDWLTNADHSIIQTELTRQDEFVKIITQLDSEKYRFATREVLALAAWLKRFVNSET
jgi:CRISPR-associated protein Cmr5